MEYNVLNCVNNVFNVIASRAAQLHDLLKTLQYHEWHSLCVNKTRAWDQQTGYGMFIVIGDFIQKEGEVSLSSHHGCWT
jgi:hypothetical protein